MFSVQRNSKLANAVRNILDAENAGMPATYGNLEVRERPTHHSTTRAFDVLHTGIPAVVAAITIHTPVRHFSMFYSPKGKTLDVLVTDAGARDTGWINDFAHMAERADVFLSNLIIIRATNEANEKTVLSLLEHKLRASSLVNKNEAE